MSDDKVGFDLWVEEDVVHCSTQSILPFKYSEASIRAAFQLLSRCPVNVLTFHADAECDPKIWYLFPCLRVCECLCKYQFIIGIVNNKM